MCAEIYQYQPAVLAYHGDEARSKSLRGIGISQMEILRSEMRLRGLSVGRRRVADRKAGVVIECTVCHGISKIDIFTPELAAMPIPEKDVKAKSEIRRMLIYEMEEMGQFDLPQVDNSYFTATDCFKAGPFKGLMLAATGTTVYLQSAAGSSNWIPVAEVANVMDPAFVRVSPSGDKIALGLGWQQNILVFNTTVLNTSTPADLNINPNPNVTVYPENHYDAAWAGEDFLIINGGQWVVPGVSAKSAILTLDVTNPNAYAQGLCGIIPGGSSSVAVDGEFNLAFGIGQGANAGEIKILSADTWWDGIEPNGSLLGYADSGTKIAESILSAAYLGFDDLSNLYVGGGEFKNPSASGPNLKSGYALLLGNGIAPIETEVKTVSPKEYGNLLEAHANETLEFAPDACKNDTATGIIITDRGIAVMWNPRSTEGSPKCVVGGNTDWWFDNVTPKITEYSITLKYVETEVEDGD